MCDTIAAMRPATASGAVLFGKNSDRDYLEAQYLEMIPSARHDVGTRVRLTYESIEQARETYVVLLSKPHWIWGAEMGANAHGLVIGNEAIFARIEASMAPGILGMDYVRLGLERAQDVDEGIHVITTLLREHGQGGNACYRRAQAYHNSFLLADPDGIKVLETVDRDWVVATVTDYYAISNAMTIESELKAAFENETKSVGGRYRRDRAMTLLKERTGSLSSADFFSILRDHQEGPSVEGRPGGRICAHRQDNPIGQTTASWVTDLATNRIVHWVTGTAAPCTGLFKPVLFETGLPDHGPKPGAEQDSAAIWWRHEQLRRFLHECSDELRSAYHEERDALEVRFLADMTRCPPVSDDLARAEASSIVSACWRDALAFEVKWFELLERATQTARVSL